jgi:hypothetical protein
MRKRIERLKVGESIKLAYDGGDKTLRVYVYGRISKAMNAKYSVRKQKNNIYLITRTV